MCGIAGVLGLDRSEGRTRLERALARLSHRGPDGSGVHLSDGVAIGMRRLAIIDLETGDQPIYDERQALPTVCNGEIYNYRELLVELASRGHRFQSKSDVNVIPHSYEERGLDAVADWRGMFAAALWDEPEQRLVLWRDRVGKKPLYYAQRGSIFAFASEPVPLLLLLEDAPSLRTAAVADYLRYGFIPQPATVYEGVFAIPPGCWLEYRPGAAPRTTRYWRRDGGLTFRGSRDEALEELDGRLRESVALRLRSDVPVGLFLSGGLDSGLVAHYAALGQRSDLKAFIVGVDDPALDEAPVAAEVAARLGIESERIELRIAPGDVVEQVATLYGQPFADSSAIPSYLVSQVARRSRKVVLNGDGGDEVFGGYRRYVLAHALGRIAAGPKANRFLGGLGSLVASRARRRGGAGFIGRALRGLGSSEAERYRIWTADVMTAGALERCFPMLGRETSIGGDDAPRCHSLRSLMQSDFRLLLPSDLLVKMDIATMANGLEARSPLLDVPLLDFAWGLPDEWLVQWRTSKPLLRSLAATRLPRRVSQAPKRGFEVPVARWLDTDLRPIVTDTLLSPESRVGLWGDRRAIANLVNRATSFPGNWAQSVWALLMLELFLRKSD